MKKLMMVAAVALTTMGANASSGRPAIGTATGYSGYTVRNIYKMTTCAPDELAGEVAYKAEMFRVCLADPTEWDYGYTKEMLYADFEDMFDNWYEESQTSLKVGVDGGIQWTRIDESCSSWKGAGYILAAMIDGDGTFSDDNTITYGYFALTDENYAAGWPEGTFDFGEFNAFFTTGPTPAPEPTSAMLLLLGVAGLALKRKRA